MTRFILAALCFFWAGVAMSQNVPNEWDIFDIAAIILMIGVCGITVSDWHK